jgi:uncharacterized protein
MTWLFDSNVLLASVLASHAHHVRVHEWLRSERVAKFATCVITQGALLRLLMRFGRDRSAGGAWRTLELVVRSPGHQFWDDGFSYLGVSHRFLQGPGQVTDAWLAKLAETRQGKLATLDEACAALHRNIAVLIPP